MKERTIARERDDQIMPAGQDLEESVGPWQTDGRVIEDADGDTIAIAVREADAQVMAAGSRMAALLWLQVDSDLLDPYFQESVEEALRDAGRELPIKAASHVRN